MAEEKSITEDRVKEMLKEAVNGLLGSEQFTKLLEDSVNRPVNALDKRHRKELDELRAALEKASGANGGGGSGGGDGADDGKGGNAQNAEVVKLQKAVDKLMAQLADETKRREETEARAARQALVKAIDDAAVSETVGVDPKRVKFLRDHLLQNGLVRLREDGAGAEMVSGQDATGDPVYKPITEALTALVKTDDGKMFMPAKSGTGAGVPANSSGRTSNGQVRSRKDLKTDADKAAFIRENGAESYLSLPAE